MMKFKEIYVILPIEIKGYLKRLKDSKQNPLWHPEGDSLIHTQIVYNRAYKWTIGDGEKEDLTTKKSILISAIFHDLGKADTTKLNDKGKWSAHGHEAVSSKLVINHKSWINSFGASFDMVYFIVSQHMRIKHIEEMKPSKRKELFMHPYINILENFTTFDDMTTLKSSEINEAYRNAI